MKATVLKRSMLQLPSASGMEVVNGSIYVIGDDAPFLYCLPIKGDKTLTHWPLFETKDFVTGRIPRATKPDLECLTLLQTRDEDYLLALGSGSSPARDKGFLVKLPTAQTKAPAVIPLDLKPLYDSFRMLAEFCPAGQMNLEGLSADKERMVLLNRGHLPDQSAALVFNFRDFVNYLLHPGTPVPAPELIQRFTLPVISGAAAGFTGACFFEGKLFFTAAAEDTPDPILDGPVYGSYIGYWIPGEESSGLVKPPVTEVRLVSNELFPGKIESLIITQSTGKNSCRGLAVTDNDQGQSELLEVEISW